MKIFTKKHFIDSVLHPARIEAKSERRTAWAFTVTAGIASAGLLQLSCYILKSCCIHQKPASIHQKPASIHQKPVSIHQKPASIHQKPVSIHQKPVSIQNKVSSSSDSEIPKALDITGKKWLTNSHLQIYFLYAAIRYPHIAVREQFLALVKDDNLETEVLKTDFFGSAATEFPFYVHVGSNHWTLLYIDTVNRTVEYFDSKKRYGNYGEIKKQLQNITKALSDADEPYQFIHKTNKTLQPDSYQCGVWVAYFLSKRLKEPDFDFNAIDITKFSIAQFRKKMMHRMIKTDRSWQKARLRKSKKLGHQAYRKKVSQLSDNGKKNTEMQIKWLSSYRSKKKPKTE